MKKIFVIDDDEEIVSVVEYILSFANYNVKATTKWQEINEGITTFSPDLVLMDISLNGADGREICKKIKQIKEWEHIPVILFSANPELGREYLVCGAHAFIPKPFELNDLLDAVKLHLY